jgi:hypothetical protein
VPDEQISNAELGRRIEHMGGELHDDLARIEKLTSQLLPREVYEAQRVAADQRVDALAARVAALESRGRWLLAGIIMPIIVVVLNWLLTAKGVKP